VKLFFLNLLWRGPFVRLWLRWKSARVAALYHRLLLRSVESKRVEGNRFPQRDKLRKLLFVCDSMWEQRELIPELSKLAEITFYNVHPHTNRNPETASLELVSSRVLDELGRFRQSSFDAVLVYLRGTLLSKELIDFFRRSWQCPLIGLNLDCKTEFEDYQVFRGHPVNYRQWAGLFDCNLTNAKAMVDVYSAAGFSVLYIPTGYHYDSAIHKPRTSASYDIGISFVGSCKPERKATVEKLVELGIPVQAFGGGWDGQKFIENAWSIYQRSQLNLGIGYNLPGERTTNLKNRDFECPGSSACYLTTYDWELANLFDIGKEILCYRSIDDLVELYSYYIRRPEECLRIGRQGYDRCVRDHTWEQRFRKSFQELGFRLTQ
jgi:spore maturation protein CgeB